MTAATASDRPRGFVPALGLGATAAMWAVSYIALMGPGLVGGEFLFALTILCLLAAGFIAGRYAHASALQGGLIGLVSGGLNMLAIGAIVGEEGTDRLISAAIWSAGVIAGSIVLTSLGAVAGRAMPTEQLRADWHSLFALGTAAIAFLLLITGGLVTGLKAGLAVTDWPNTFGHNMLLYPLEQMKGGVYYEHAHRLYGTLVGLTTIILFISTFIYDSRKWLRGVTALALLMVIVQGIMGGMRVTGHPTLSTDAADMQPSTLFAILHGVFGQIVFATLVAIAAFCSVTWKSDEQPQSDENADAAQRGSKVLVHILLTQLVLGVLYRHLRDNPDVHVGIRHGLLTLHVVFAMVVVVALVAVSGRIWGRYASIPILRRISGTMLLLVGLQLLLGITATVLILVNPEDSTPVGQVIVTTAHQANGALILALATLQAIWTRRLLTPAE